MRNILIFIIALGLFACKQDPDPIQPPTGCGMTIDQFPLKVGNSWTYEGKVFDHDENRYLNSFKITFKIYEIKVKSLDTIFIGFIKRYDENGDLIYIWEDSIIKSKDKIVFNQCFLLNPLDYNTINFPLKCNYIDTVYKFNNSDTLGARYSLNIYAVKDTLINSQIGSFSCVKTRQYSLINYNFVDSNFGRINYFSPGVGFVKIIIDGMYISDIYQLDNVEAILTDFVIN